MAIRQPPSSIKDANLRGFLSELRNAIGKTGEQVNQVAMRVRQITNTPQPPTEPPDPGPPGPPGPPGEPGDGLAPPAPISLTATSDAWAIRLTWEQPADMPADYDQTEIWCRNATSGDKLLAGSLRGNQFVFTGLDDHLLSNDETWYFWVRNKDVENLFSGYYPNNDVGVEGKALPSPEDYIDDLTGDITEGTLWDYLGAKIGLLQGPAGLPDSVNARLASQYNDLVQRIDSIEVSGNGTIDPIEIWHFDASVQGWTVTGTGASVSMVNGVLVVTAGSTAATVLSAALATPFSGSAYRAIRARLKQVKAAPTDSDWNRTVVYKETGSSTVYEYIPDTSMEAPGSLTGFIDYDWDLAEETGENWISSTISQVGFKLAAGQTLHFDWVAVGRIAPGASYSQVEAVRVLSDNKTRVFFQATAPTNPYSDGYALKANDLWFDTDDGNKPYRWNGSVWAETTDTRLADSWAEIYDIRTANANPSGAAAQRINGIAANATSAMATGAANTAAIQAEATARANEDAALAQQIDQITAGVNYSSRVFIQTTAPVSDSNYTLKTNDLWYDTSVSGKVTLKYWDGDSWEVRRSEAKTFYKTTAPTVATDGALLEGDLWFDTDDNNKPYIRSGSSWVSVLEGYINTLADAKITTFEQTKVGYATVTSGFSYNGVDYVAGNLFDNNGQIWTKAHVDTWNAANPTRLLTWNAKLPIATAIKQVRVSDGATSATIEQQFAAKKDIDNKLLAQYTVKIDNNGWVSGFGIASEQQADGTVYSDFGIRADRFWLGAPSSPTNTNGVGVDFHVLNSSTGLVGASVSAKRADGTDFRMGYFRTTSALAANVGDWIHIKDARTSNRATPNDGWNQSFKVFGKGGFSYKNSSGATVNSSALPYLGGVTTNLIAIDFGTATSIQDAYTALSTATPPNNYPTKAVGPAVIPFIVTTTTRTIDGVSVPPGVYITDTYIRNATITNAKIADAAITMAKITKVIQSANFNGGFKVNGDLDPANPGTTGWAIDQPGTAILNSLIVRTGNLATNAVTSIIANSTNGLMSWRPADLAYPIAVPLDGTRGRIALIITITIQAPSNAGCAVFFQAVVNNVRKDFKVAYSSAANGYGSCTIITYDNSLSTTMNIGLDSTVVGGAPAYWSWGYILMDIKR